MDLDGEQLTLFCAESFKLCYVTHLYLKEKKKRSCATREMLQKRQEKGYYKNLLQEMRLGDVESFKNFHRMDPTTFDNLLAILGPSTRTVPARMREEITASERLALTLRYLASGDSMKSIGFYGFRIGASTTSNIIRETCALIWEKMKFVFPTPSEEVWKGIANDFEQKWNFPNCLGAIDGKHVVIQAFPKHNSLTFNYKHTHSIVLMAVADANYKFSMVDIGALGHNSDGGVFRTSRFGNYILHHPGELKIPESKPLPNYHEEAPFVFVADEAFPLRRNILRPYPGRSLGVMPVEEEVFNNRLSRARRVVENAFGIMANRFRIYRRPIIASKETSENIVKATVCLHNWLRDRTLSGYFSPEMLESDGTLITDNTNAGMLPITASRANRSSQEATKIRQVFTKYFNETHI